MTKRTRYAKPTKKNKHAQAMAKLRSKSLTPARRSEIAKNASITRWNKVKNDKKLSTEDKLA